MFSLVLAGGKGERLRPPTEELPKPMVPLCGKPVLEHPISWLKAEGVTDIVFLAGFYRRGIQDYFAYGRRFNNRAHYCVEDSPLGRGGAIKRGLNEIKGTDGPVVVLNGDTITEEPLVTLLESHEKQTAANPVNLATMMVVPCVSPYGLVDLSPHGGVIALRGKVTLPYWISAGIYLFDQKIAPELPEVGDHEEFTFTKLAQQGQILAVKSSKFWIGIDSLKD